MDVEVLDENFRTFYVIDDYISLLWVERYYEAGEFELLMGPKEDFLYELWSRVTMVEDVYFRIKDSDRVMILDTAEITTDQEEGKRVKIKGNSLEIILDRRIYWGGFKLWESQELSSFLWYCLYFNVTDPKDTNRRISNFRFSDVDWPVMGEGVMTLNKEYTSETIYEMISEQCKYNSYGFKVLLTPDNHFEFVLYKGVDRTPIGNQNDYVIISPKYDNLSESNYLRSYSNFKNVTLIEAKGQAENERIFKTKSLADLNYKGLRRREVYTDGRNISWNKSDYTTIDSSNSEKNKEKLTNAEFQNLMFESGQETLEDHGLTVAFEGVIEPNVSFIYGVDYNLGDIVYVVDQDNTQGKARITEVTRSYDESGDDMSFTLEDQDVID